MIGGGTSGEGVRRIEKAEAEKLRGETAPKTGKKSKGKTASKKQKPLPEIEQTSEEMEDLDEEIKHGIWNRALLLAGLEPYEPVKKKGLSFIEGVHLYIEATGKLPPTKSEVERLAREVPFSLSHPESGELTTYFGEVAAYRAQLGLPMADEIAKAGEPKFDLTKMPPNLPKPVPQPGDWANNEQAVIDALYDYLDDAAKRGVKRVTRADYRDRQEGVRRGDWPSASTLGRTGPKSFTEWIKKAQPQWQERRKAKKAA